MLKLSKKFTAMAMAIIMTSSNAAKVLAYSDNDQTRNSCYEDTITTNAVPFTAEDSVIYVGDKILYRTSYQKNTENGIETVKSTYMEKISNVNGPKKIKSNKSTSGTDVYFLDLVSKNLNNTTVNYILEGYCSWNSKKDTVSIRNYKAYVSGSANGVTITHGKIEHEDNTGGFFLGLKYAYARCTFKAEGNGLSNSQTLYIECNVEGVMRN